LCSLLEQVSLVLGNLGYSRDSFQWASLLASATLTVN
jgi:hypothetical protein